MSSHGKKYFNALKKAPKKAVSLEEAVKFVKDNAGAKFDETVDVYFHLGKELTKGDTAVRGTVKLPNGSGKKVRVAVFAGGDAAEAAKAAGADFVGMADLIEKVTKEGWCDFDVAIATVEAMKEVRKCARILGPRGLMPNPKTGTVTMEIGAAVKASKGGKIDFKVDKTGIVHTGIGKASFSAQQLYENAAEVLNAIAKLKPQALKGTYMKSAALCSTMSPGIKIDLKAFLNKGAE